MIKIKKECCGTCGFPTGIKREPIILTNNILSIVSHQENTCDDCGHQKDGSTIPVVYNFWQKLCRNFIKERKNLINFIRYYNNMNIRLKRGICIYLPRYMNKDYKGPKPKFVIGMDVEIPYSWNTVYKEVIRNTELSKIMLSEIDWNKVK